MMRNKRKTYTRKVVLGKRNKNDLEIIIKKRKLFGRIMQGKQILHGQMVLMTATGANTAMEVSSRLQYSATRSENTHFHPRILKGCSFNQAVVGLSRTLEVRRAILPSKT